MFIYAKVGHSKFVEMHGDASDFYRSALVFYTQHQVNITIYRTFYLHTDMCVVKWNEHFTETLFFHYVNVVFIKLEIPL